MFSRGIASLFSFPLSSTPCSRMLENGENGETKIEALGSTNSKMEEEEWAGEGYHSYSRPLLHPIFPTLSTHEGSPDRDSIRTLLSVNAKADVEVCGNRSLDGRYQRTSTGEKPKIGLDHLDNLCKLMEQLADLREQNSILQKRVQYLEDLKTLQEMHRELESDLLTGCRDSLGVGKATDRRNYPLLRHGSAESLIKEKLGAVRPGKATIRRRRTLLKSRGRSKSMGSEEMDPMAEKAADVREAEGKLLRQSKWTKVKEAFKWEKMGAGDSSPVSHNVTVNDRESVPRRDSSQGSRSSSSEDFPGLDWNCENFGEFSKSFWFSRASFNHELRVC